MTRGDARRRAASRPRDATPAPAPPLRSDPPRLPMATDPSRDQARNLAELRRIAYRLSAPGMTRGEVEASLRVHPDALTFMARLRRGGMSDAAVAAALFEQPEPEA